MDAGVLDIQRSGDITEYLPLIAAIGVHHVELPLAPAVREEDYLLSIGAPFRSHVVGPWLDVVGTAGQWMAIAPIGIHDVDLPMVVLPVHEGDACPIGRPHRVVVIRIASQHTVVRSLHRSHTQPMQLGGYPARIPAI